MDIDRFVCFNISIIQKCVCLEHYLLFIHWQLHVLIALLIFNFCLYFFILLFFIQEVGPTVKKTVPLKLKTGETIIDSLWNDGLNNTSNCIQLKIWLPQPLIKSRSSVMTELDDKPTLEKVGNVTEALLDDKAPGSDRISPEVVKCGKPLLSKYLHVFFLFCFVLFFFARMLRGRICSLRSAWCQYNHSLQEKGDRSDCNKDWYFDSYQCWKNTCLYSSLCTASPSRAGLPWVTTQLQTRKIHHWYYLLYARHTREVLGTTVDRDHLTLSLSIFNTKAFEFRPCKAKKNKCYVSKLVTNWKIWPKCGFFQLFFFPQSSRRVRFESVTALKYGTWFLDEQDTRQNTELKKYVVQSVSLCLTYLFLYILTRKFVKNWKKKLSKQKNFKPWILLNQTRTEKQMRAAALRHMIYFF